MLDAGIISLPASCSKRRSPVSSERTSTPQTPRAMIGAPKTCAEIGAQLRGRRRSAGRGGRATRLADVGGGCCGRRSALDDDERRQRATERRTRPARDYLISSSALTMASSAAASILAAPGSPARAREDVGAVARERDLLLALALVRLDGDGQLRLVERRSWPARRRSRSPRGLGDGGDQVVDLRLIGVLGGRRHLLPSPRPGRPCSSSSSSRSVVVDAVAHDLDAGGVERAARRRGPSAGTRRRPSSGRRAAPTRS